MRRIIWFNMITLDGHFEGPNRDISWHNVDEEFNDFAIDQLNSLDTLLFGRLTYDMMAGYWPTEMALNDDPIVAGKMNAITKVVYSTKLNKADWSNSSILKKDINEQTARLKEQPGRDMAIFGSGILGNSLLQAGLIDEIRLMVAPIILGQGRPLFEPAGKRIHLKQLDSRQFANGNVLLNYQVT